MKKYLKNIIVIFSIIHNCIIISSDELSIQDLPVEIIRNIFEILPIESRFNLKLTSHFFDFCNIEKNLIYEDVLFLKHSPLQDRIKTYIKKNMKFTIDHSSPLLFRLVQKVLIKDYFFSNTNPLQNYFNTTENSDDIVAYYANAFKCTISKDKDIKIPCYIIDRTTSIEKNLKKHYLGVDCAGLYQEKLDATVINSFFNNGDKKQYNVFLFNTDYEKDDVEKEQCDVLIENIRALIERFNKDECVKRIIIDHLMHTLAFNERACFHDLICDKDKKINIKSFSREVFKIMLSSTFRKISSVVYNLQKKNIKNFTDYESEHPFFQSLIKCLKIQSDSKMHTPLKIIYDSKLYEDFFWHLFNSNFIKTLTVIEILGIENIHYYIKQCEAIHGTEFEQHAKKKFNLTRSTDDTFNEKLSNLMHNCLLPSIKNAFLKNYCFNKIILPQPAHFLLSDSIKVYEEHDKKASKKIRTLKAKLDTELSKIRENEATINRLNTINDQLKNSIKLEQKKIEQLEEEILKKDEKYESLNNINNLLNQQKTQLEENNKLFLGEINIQKQTIENNNKQMRELNTQYDEINNKYNETKTNNDALEADSITLVEQLEVSKTNCNEQLKKIEDNKNIINAHNKTIKDQKNQIFYYKSILVLFISYFFINAYYLSRSTSLATNI